MQIRVGMIGCGRRARSHARGYAHSADTTFVGYADPKHEAACKLADEFGDAPKYTSHMQMLAEAKPTMVSVATWPQIRLQVVLDCIDAGVKAIHCEKPMAVSWGDSRRMHEACADAGVQLTFCHQRRYVPQYERAREMVGAGDLGEIHLFQGLCHNFFDWGTHWFDMFHFFNDESPAQWVMAQADLSKPRQVFGAPLEAAGISQVRFENGRSGQLITGDATADRKHSVVRVIGEKGVLEVSDWGKEGPLRILRDGGPGAWEYPTFEKDPVEDYGTLRTVQDAVEGLREGNKPRCSSDHALRATELIYASYLSARRGGRVDLPLAPAEFPLAGFFDVPPAQGY